MSDRETCPFHEKTRSDIADLDKRLALNESEVERMDKKLELISTKLDQVIETVNTWAIRFSFAAGIAALVVNKWDWIRGMLQI